MILWESYSIIATLGRKIARRTKYKQVEEIVEAFHAVGSTYPDRAQMPVIFVARIATNQAAFSIRSLQRGMCPGKPC